MNFSEAQQYFENLAKRGSILGLEPVTSLLKVLGNPQDTLKVVHVAGTNGKGSTIAFLESVLKTAGYKVGVYTSPVVFDYLEKIRINGNYISEEEFISETKKIIEANNILEREKGICTTVFESETAMAFDYFAAKNCDIVIIETGMGGSADATNVCSKVECSVLTSISMDHTAFLGDTLQEIATVKAGIIKDGCNVVVSGTNTEVLDTIDSVCKARKTTMSVSRKPVIKKNDFAGIIFDYVSSAGIEYKDLRISMIGSYQPDNAAVAIECIEKLAENGYIISRKDIRKGLEAAVWKGRFEKVRDNPLIFVDGAHNPGAAVRLKETIDRYFKGYKKIFIMGVLADKDYEDIISTVLGDAEMIYTLTPHNTRGLEAGKLKESILKVNPNVRSEDGYKNVVTRCFEMYKELDKQSDVVIVAFGSLSYLGELMKEISYVSVD